ncbi:MAG: hypothetical protein K2K06_04265, partial [Oscillospiraceae bacterium]|nr:hypothetical protein [Oscillospiraceae bacterium]
MITGTNGERRGFSLFLFFLKGGEFLAEITGVIKNSLADKAGIQVGELLISINQHT